MTRTETMRGPQLTQRHHTRTALLVPLVFLFGCIDIVAPEAAPYIEMHLPTFTVGFNHPEAGVRMCQVPVTILAMGGSVQPERITFGGAASASFSLLGMDPVLPGLPVDIIADLPVRTGMTDIPTITVTLTETGGSVATGSLTCGYWR
jgi:hypothetical protein